MAGGTSSNPVWVGEGMYLSFTVNETNGITLGLACELDTTTSGQCSLITDGSTVPAGVAVAGPRTSRTQTDNIVPDGMEITVCGRGVCYVQTSAEAVTIGAFIQGAGSGYVKSLTLSAVTDVNKILGRALTATTGSGVEELKALITVS